MNWKLLGLCMLMFFGAGCSRHVQQADLGGLYTRAAQQSDLTRNPVIVIPGILGTRLEDAHSGTVAWGAYTGQFADPRKPEGARYLSLPMKKGVPLGELVDGVEPAGALEEIELRVLGVLPVRQAAYLQILRTLGAGGYRDQQLAEAGAIDYGDDHFTCFQFPYDWRRSNVENAKLLGEFIRERKAYVERELKQRYGVEKDVKFDIVAHSMGGLVSRWFLRYGEADLPADGSLPEVTWAGAEYVERAVIIGTPNAGSILAFLQLVEGFTPKANILPFYQKSILGTMPAVYELLPRTRHFAYVAEDSLDDEEQRKIDIFDPEVWEKYQWGLADPEQAREGGVLDWLIPNAENFDERQEVALEHQRKCLERAAYFHAALDTPAESPDGLSLYLIAGDSEVTPEQVSIDQATGEVEIVKWGPGDATVLRTSALLDERNGFPDRYIPGVRTPIPWHHVLFLFQDHIGLTRDPTFADNVLFLLLEKPRPSIMDDMGTVLDDTSSLMMNKSMMRK